MEILPFLLGITVIIFIGAILLFFWSVNSGQYDDLESPAHQILYDDDDDLLPPEVRANHTSGTDSDKEPHV
ncbi:MAG: cbb3-type cytochrome oxidase assembly protein CcoS [Oceanospirillaceae bacterium]|nr:cbb3-type cytochrome oxidase assembly protein CcoS [Oceanospirillaceae bacterium]